MSEAKLSITDNDQFKIAFTNAKGEQVERQSPSLLAIQKLFVSEVPGPKDEAANEFMEMFGDGLNPVHKEIRNAYWKEFFGPR